MLRFIYRWLLHLHPAGFRQRFGNEMLSIFDQVEGKQGAAKLVADIFLSFCRQWALRSEYWKEKETEPLHSPADGVPVFYTLQSFTPRTSALINGAILTLLIFCGVCLALKYNWTHPVYLRFSNVRFEFDNDNLQPAVSATLPEDGTPASRDRLTNPERAASVKRAPISTSRATQPSTDGSLISESAVAPTPANMQAQVTPAEGVRSYSATPIVVKSVGTLQRKDPFARQLFIARFYFVHRDYPKAVTYYRQALEIWPNDPDAIFGLAQSLEKSGSTVEAQTAYRAYLQAAPNGQFAEECRAALRRMERSSPR